MRSIDHISVSQMNLYLMCSLKYRFQYVDKLPKPFKASALAFGGAVHSAIEWLHKERIKGKDVLLGELFSIFDADWYSQTVETEIRYKEGETFEGLKEKAREILTLYAQQGPPKTRASELPFQVPLINSETGEVLPVPIKGYMDLIEEGEIITEIKTAAKAYDADLLDLQLQLTAYHYAYMVLFRQEPKGLKLINLTKGKKPKMEILPTERTAKDHNRLFATAREFLKALEAGVFLPNPSYRCKDCEYFGVCQEWGGGE